MDVTGQWPSAPTNYPGLHPLENQLGLPKAQVIQEYIDVLAKALSKAPTGRMQLHSSKGYPRFYYYKDDTSPGQYLSANEMLFISSICQRDYNLKALDYLKKALADIGKGKSVELMSGLDAIYNSFRRGKKELIIPLVKPIDKFIEEWYEHNQSHQNGFEFATNITTNRGEQVRSKSEKIIADKLYEMEIPYVYEPALDLGGYRKSPDFFVMNKRTRQTFIWEHLGLADRQDYNDNNINKIALYECYGIYSGQSLILSFESMENPLDTHTIEEKIRSFLLWLG